MSDMKYYIYFLLGKMKKSFFRAYPEDDQDVERSLKTEIASNACISTTSTLATGTFLVLLMTQLGMSDGNMGLILTFHNFANLAQLISIKVSGRIVKNKLFVFIFELQRILLGLLFFLPLLAWKSEIKTIVFVALYCFVQICLYICNPAKVDWIDGLVREEARGSFYSLRQSVCNITTLLAGFVMGVVVDFLKDDNINLLLPIMGITVMASQAIGMILMLFMKEKRVSAIDESGHEVVGSLVKKRHLLHSEIQNVSIVKEFLSAIRSKLFRKLLVVECLWLLGYSIIAFYNTSYLLNELNLSYTLISSFSIILCVSQLILGPRLGKLADKVGTVRVTMWMVLMMAIHSLTMTFAVPSNALWMFILSRVFYMMGYAFVFVGILNIKLERIEAEKRIIWIAMLGIISGVFTYAISIVGSAFIDWFQKIALTTEKHMGYAQQYLNAMSFIVLLVLTIYLKLAFKDKEGKN